MKSRLFAAAAILILITAFASAQTTVIARPACDAGGYAVFEITQIIRIEGKWTTPPTVGSLLYPDKPQKAFPLSRFGEAVVIALPLVDNLDRWQGVYVHGGYIPALNGISLNSLIKNIVSRPEDPVQEAAPKETVKPLTECPICHRFHLHS